MIIEITQTESNLQQKHEISCAKFAYHGEAGFASSLQQIKMSNADTSFCASFSLPKPVNNIPFVYLFGIPKLSRLFKVRRNNADYCTFVFSQRGFFKSLYVITFDDGTSLNCYERLKGSFDYVSVYLNNEQIALKETYLCCGDYKYKHKIYLSDSYERFGDILSLFTIYYANFNFAHRMHMSSVSNYETGFTISRYNDKYDPNWRETHFPDENFFGKASLFSD